MRYNTVVFDLDGTLLNTLEDLCDSVNYALSSCGFPTRSQDEVRAFVGSGVARLIALSVPKGTPPRREAECLGLFRAHYVLNMENKTAPYPGILDLLRRLSGEGFQLAIVSNKFDSAVKGLAQTYFGDLFPVAIGEGTGVAKKPAPDTVFKALAELNADAGQAVYVGDSDVDIATAKNAGLPCISVSWGFRDSGFLAAHGAARIVDDIDALYRTLTE